jgi:hypothetical protein
MTDYLKQNLKTDLALSFAQSFAADSNDNYFLFLGRITEWPDDNNPPTIVDSLSEELQAWRDMMALAKINKSNVMVGAARYDWEYNKVFDQFDDTVDLYVEGSEKQFYCITEDYNVYKCISNNYGAASLYKPTAVTSEEQITEDGYVWKFMFKVREELYEFLTDEFIPIEKLESILYNDERTLQNNVKIAAVPSSIENVILVQAGGAYPLAITKDPTDTDQRHRLTEIISSTQFIIAPVSDVEKTSGIYNDYYELYIAEGTGAGQKAVITDFDVTDGVITVTVDTNMNVNTDSVYRIYPRIKITGDGENASVIPVMNDSKVITDISIVNSGKNYHYADMEVYRKNATYANKTLVRAILSPVSGHGYDAIRELGANMVLIHIPLRNAEKINEQDAINILNNDYRQVGIVKNAYNYDLTPITVEDNLKTYIEIENINSKSYIYFETNDNMIIGEGDIIKQGSENNNYQARGIVDSVEETSANNYTITVSNTNGRFLPSTSSSYPIILERTTETIFSGTITGVVVTNLYDNDTFTVGDYVLGTTSASSATITKWECNPYGLSGKLYIDNIKGSFVNSYYNKTTDGVVLVRGEHLVSYASINSSTGQLEGTSPSTVGIIKSVSTVESENKVFYKVSTTLNIIPTTGVLTSSMFSADDIIVNSDGVQGKVISFSLTNSTHGILEVNGLTGSFAVDDVLSILTETESTTNSKISSIVAPEVLPYYGDMIYIQNVIPVTAANDAEEHIKVLIKF